MAKKDSSSIAVLAADDSYPSVLFYDRHKKLGLSTVPLETAALLPRIGELVQLPGSAEKLEPPHDYCVVDIRYIYRKAMGVELLECVRPGKKLSRSVGDDAVGMHLLCVRIELDPTE